MINKMRRLYQLRRRSSYHMSLHTCHSLLSRWSMYLCLVFSCGPRFTFYPDCIIRWSPPKSWLGGLLKNSKLIHIKSIEFPCQTRAFHPFLLLTGCQAASTVIPLLYLRSPSHHPSHQISVYSAPAFHLLPLSIPAHHLIPTCKFVSRLWNLSLNLKLVHLSSPSTPLMFTWCRSSVIIRVPCRWAH